MINIGEVIKYALILFGIFILIKGTLMALDNGGFSLQIVNVTKYR